jgi:superoxide dismutase, Fe-Mn family
MFTLPKLPYAEDALEPHISAKTLALHHGKHHKTYVDTLNKLVADEALADLSLEEVIKESFEVPARHVIFNNAAQSWSHDFFWKSMKPDGGGPPTGDLRVLIEHDIGDMETFSAAFNKTAAEHFGSGWLWLVATDGVVAILTTHDADLPLVQGRTALLCCDLWEHAYYIDYQNRRAEFVTAFLDHLANWDFANANLADAASALNEEVSEPLEPNDASFVIPVS